MNERLHPSCTQEIRPWKNKEYRGIIFAAIAAKVFNALFLIHIWPEIEKILGKIRTIFEEMAP